MLNIENSTNKMNDTTVNSKSMKNGIVALGINNKSSSNCNTRNKKINSERSLPQTGEDSITAFIVLGVVLVIWGLSKSKEINK